MRSMATSKGVRQYALVHKSGHMWRSISLAISLAALMLRTVYAATLDEEANALETVLTSLHYTLYNSTMSPCTWNPAIVTCDPTTNAITALNLSNMGLFGTIPPQIGVFSSLTSLDLSKYNNSLGAPNKIVGPLPDGLGDLAELQFLNLTWNPINTNFPPCLLRLTNLVELRIDNTNLTGSIPPQISNLKNLQHLFIGNNQLVGPFPHEFGDMINLQELTVWGNNFGDQIPDSLGNLVNLTYLNMHDCFMWGGIPASLGNLKSVSKLWLYNNVLTGPIPDTWKGLTNVSDLNIRSNFLSGAFPLWLPTLPKLKRLDVSKNSFSGPFPGLNESQSLLAAFTNALVQNFDMSCNYFNGTFPTNTLPNINITQNCFANSTKESDSCQRAQNCDKWKYYMLDGKGWLTSACLSPNTCLITVTSITGGCPACPTAQKLIDIQLCVCAPTDWNPSTEQKSVRIGAIVGGAIGGIAVLLAIFALYRYRRIDFKDPFQKKRTDYGTWEVPSGVQKFSFQELSKATGNWSEAHEIGRGGFGKVFRGVLEDGRVVAIKRASQNSLQGTLEFRNEVLLLSRLHHRHLVRLEGFSDDRGLQILVYEFMKNGNLHDLITGMKKGTQLSWFTRLEIAVGVAQGLDYLHSFADPPVIHRDIKPSNILLDDHLVAKVADFGISKETPELDTHISTRPAGTAGYLDPEYFLRRQLTTASDVYAYGVCLLELITGQQAIDHMRLEEYNLIEWVKPRFKTGGVAEVVDSSLGDDYDKEVLKVMTEVAIMCSAFSKNDRPSMKEVLTLLEPHLKAFPTSVSSLSDKVAQLPTRDDGGKARRGSASEIEAGHADVTSSSTGSISHFDMEPLVPR